MRVELHLFFLKDRICCLQSCCKGVAVLQHLRGGTLTHHSPAHIFPLLSTIIPVICITSRSSNTKHDVHLCLEWYFMLVKLTNMTMPELLLRAF